jgi:hypothetical protein
LLVACGGDDGVDPPVCGGHGSSCGPFAEDVPEGGEFRIELQKSGTDGTISAATHAYFYKDQTPAARPLMGPEFPAGSGCIDMTAGIYFDNGSGPMATQIADTRTYIDAGASVKIKHAQKEITLDKLMNEKDYSSLLTHDIVYLPASADGSDYPTNAAYSVEWTGGELGAMTMTEPTDSGTNEAIESQLFVPAPMTNINPSFASNLQFPATGDWEVTYEKAAAPAGSPFEMTFILFLNESTGGAEYQCTGDPSTGKLTVPRALLDKLQPTGLALFGTFTQIGHMQSGRRLDTVGVNCTYQNYTKQ